MLDKFVDYYLGEIDSFIGNVGFSKKQIFLKELKVKIDSMIELRNGAISKEEIIEELGTARRIAYNFSKKNGASLRKQSSGVLKFLLWSFAAFLIFLFLSIVFISYKFTPMVEIKDEKIRLMGGNIILDDFDKFFSTVNLKVNTGHEISHSISLKNKNISQLNIKFSNGKYTFNNTSEEEFSYTCKGLSSMKEHLETDNSIELDLSGQLGTMCDFSIPQGKLVIVNGENGLVNFREIQNSLNLDIKTGSIIFEPLKTENYDYELRVNDGHIDEFENSKDTQAYKIKINLGKGNIKKL